MKTNLTVFWIDEYASLGARIGSRVAGQTGAVEVKSFSDGERYMRIQTVVRDRDVVLVGGTIHDKATLDLFDLACGLVAEGCRSLKVLIPYFGYSTMERATQPGEVVTAKTRARIFSAVPMAPFGNKIVMLDLHSEGIPFYFEGHVRAEHLYAKALILKEARRLGGQDFTLGAPDAGRAKWVQSLANDLGVPAGFVYKKRAEDGSVSVSGVNVTIKGRDVVLYDDMIRSGSSILQAAQAYKDAGARTISLLTTHGIFTSGAVGKIKKSGLVESITCTDSHPNALRIDDPFVTVVSTDAVFADYLLFST